MTEQHTLCDLIPENKTVSIGEFEFGKLPTSNDVCSGATITCILDETPVSNLQNKRWWEVNDGGVLFKFTQDPINFDLVRTSPQDPNSIYTDVKLSNSLNSDQVPKSVQLDINYYQWSSTDKRIVSAKLTISDGQVPTQSQGSGAEVVYYTLVVNFQPVTYLDLLVGFAFDSKIYFVLYILVGLIILSYGAGLALHHWLLTR